MKFIYCSIVTVIFVGSVFAQSPSNSANILRNAVERGERGDGQQQVWMADLKALGIKQVSFAFDFKWKNGLITYLDLRSVDYHPVYYSYNVKITDEDVLRKIEARVTPILIKEARHGATVVVGNVLKGDRKAHGIVYINLLDDGRLPAMLSPPEIEID